MFKFNNICNLYILGNVGMPVCWSKNTVCEKKDADQLCSNYTADQRLCFRYTDSTIPLLPKSKISSSSHFQWLHRSTCVVPRRPVFSRRGADNVDRFWNDYEVSLLLATKILILMKHAPIFDALAGVQNMSLSYNLRCPENFFIYITRHSWEDHCMYIK